MTSFELAEYCAKISLDKKAENVLILNLENKSSVADYYVICSGQSDRQACAIGEWIADTLRKDGVRAIHQEGFADGRWVLIDFGDVIVHIFQDHFRDFYNLEQLWSEAPRIRLRDSSTSDYSHGSMHA